MKKRQAKKGLKRWAAQRHATLRRAVEATTRAARSGEQIAAAIDLLRVGLTSREIALRRWIRRLWEAREATRTPVAELDRRLGGAPRGAFYVRGCWEQARRTEQIYLASRREEAAPLIPQPPGRGASITHSDATRRSVTFPLSAVSVTYGS